MPALLNTSFFFAPSAADQVTATLRSHWIPACNAAGTAPAVCLRMPAEEGIMRLAVQTPFATAQEAENFRARITDQLGREMLRKLGPDAFTCFSTIMEIIEL